MNDSENGSAGLRGVEELFQSSVLPLEALKPGRNAAFVILRALSILFGLYLVAILVGLFVHARDVSVLSIYFLNPLATIESFGKLTLLIALALIAAYNEGVRRAATGLLIVAHVLVVTAALALYATTPDEPFFPDHRSLLLDNVIVDGVLLVVLILLIISIPRQKPDPEFDRYRVRQAGASGLMQIVLLVYGVAFGLVALLVIGARCVLDPLSEVGSVSAWPDPLMVNVVTKYGLLAVMSFYLYRVPSRRRIFLPILIAVLSVAVFSGLIATLWGDTTIITRADLPIRVPWLMTVEVLMNGVALGLLIGVRAMQYRVDFQVTALGPTSAECVMSLHEAFREIAQKPGLSSREVLHRIDEFIVGIHGKKRGLIAFPFWLVEHIVPLASGARPPFSLMSRDEQRWMLRKYVLRPGYERKKSLIPALADALFAIGDMTHTLLTFAYFSSKFGQAEVGYILPNARGRLQADIATKRPPELNQPPSLPKDFSDSGGKKPVAKGGAFPLLTPRVSMPPAPVDIPEEVDYCIIGSGAAGGVLAYRLGVAKGDTSSICVLERGGYYSPLQDFNDDEMQMVRTLYAEGGLEATKSFDFNILQGQCVGGSTVVNNALCFEMPEVSRSEWRSLGIDVDSLDVHYQKVADEIQIREVVPEAVNERVEKVFSSGIQGYSAPEATKVPLSPARRMHGNFSNCVGCGLCNLGCRRVRKLSTLETYLPWAQARGVTVVPEAVAVKCISEGTRVRSVVVRMSNGVLRKVAVKKAVVLAGGAIASSRFLLCSGLGGPHVGMGVSCNYAFPMVLEFRETLDAFDGLQMTLFSAPEKHEMVFETTFNPPGSQSLMTPQYFRDHARMMQAYRRSMVVVALVGSDPSGTISKTPSILFGREVEWNQTADEIARVRKALSTGVRIAGAAGATRILLPTHPVLEIPLDSSVEKVLTRFENALHDKQYFRFATPHPQGGNMMAGPSTVERVAELDFRVRDCDNLFVCDASIFPRSIRINPQWTIMALASRAGEAIAGMT